MKQRKPFWRVLFFCFALVLAVPVVSLLQNPMEAEAAAPKLSKKKATVKEGKTITLTVKNPTQKVTWKSSNSKVVKITKKTGSNKSKATLKGLKKGTAYPLRHLYRTRHMQNLRRRPGICSGSQLVACYLSESRCLSAMRYNPGRTRRPCVGSE